MVQRGKRACKCGDVGCNYDFGGMIMEIVVGTMPVTACSSATSFCSSSGVVADTS